jgi:hypothetical protein
VNSIFFIDDRAQDKDATFSVIEASAKLFMLDSSFYGFIGALSSIDSDGSVNLSDDSVDNTFAGNLEAVSDYTSSKQLHTEIYDTESTPLPAESIFGIDANNDGIIGALSSIDSSGFVSLSVDSVGNIFAGNLAVKTDSSQQIHTGIYGTEWTALAAEKNWRRKHCLMAARVRRTSYLAGRCQLAVG